jgi:FAD/FMN-containing dehydrogenase/Fe-S oxidoreductase
MATINTADLESALRRRVAGQLHFDPLSKALYSTDASLYQMEPIGVLTPRDANDVEAAVSICSDMDVPLLPRGGGTSLAGQTVNHALVMDFTKSMHRVLEVNPEEQWVRTQPGITLDELNRQLQPHGLHFPPDPTTSNRATVGGAIGNNSCGAHSILYGKTSDHVMELNVVLADGTPTYFQHSEDSKDSKVLKNRTPLETSIYKNVARIASEQGDEIHRRYPGIMRRVSGYNIDLMVGEALTNLTPLVVGSEGTLCTVTEAKLHLEPIPKSRALSVIHFKSIIEAMEATVVLLEHPVAAIELVDRMLLERARLSLGFARRMTFVEGNPEALLLVELFGNTQAELSARMGNLEQALNRRGLGYSFVRAITPEQQADVWAVRSAGLGLLMSVKGDAKPLPFVEDAAVPPEVLPEYVRRFQEIVRAHDTTAGYYGHASVGCLHIRPMVNIKLQEGLDTLVSIADAISDLVLEFGGSLSGEHGDGIVRGAYTEKMFGPQIYNAFKELKYGFDPKGIMNPGKIVDCPPITENLRIGPSYKTVEIDTVMDFSNDGGFARSVELCNGVGACRKLTGTMCPSYMVTRDERHSTRGRANALRSVLSGVLPASELTGKRLHDTLDLCLECKGCKSECPSNVDMAKLKYEFLYRYNKIHGIPLRARLFAHIALVNRWSGYLGPLANISMNNSLVRWFLHFFLGIHKSRKLPNLTSQNFPEWFRKRNCAEKANERKVVLFHDTFMDYNHPEVGKAAVELLEAAGYQIILADKVCCGRPMISKGMLEQARNYARINVDRLYSYAQAGLPIVGCEPSCLLTLRDEYPDLLRDEKSRLVANNSMLIEDFLISLHQNGKLSLRFKETTSKILFHGHCHQKALSGTSTSLAALRLIPGLQVEEIDSGCCGMAGAFGYEREHYELSMAVGAQKLFPAIAANPDAQIAINGVSCRHQILDGTNRQPRHIAEILREALEDI